MTRDLRTAALAAYEEQQAVERGRREEKAKSAERAAAARFRAISGVDALGVATRQDGLTAVYAADGLSFQWHDRNLYLLDECPRCGDYCMGQQIYNLESLGEALADGFAPNYTHNCGTMVALPEMNDVQAAIDHLDHGIGLADMAGRNFPDTPHDAAVLGQLRALIAIALELRRANDRNDRQDDHQDAREYRAEWRRRIDEE